MRKSVTLEEIEKEIEILPVKALQEVKDFIKTLKIKKTTKGIQKKKPYSVFDEITDAATDVGIKDWARNHDHYIYGIDKRQCQEKSL